jgi:GDP-L-fucose synthase
MNTPPKIYVVAHKRMVGSTNLYGPGDNYHTENFYVLPGLIRTFHEAKMAGLPKVLIWGTGKRKREFLYLDDMAAASVHVMILNYALYTHHTLPTQGHINVGYGSDVSIEHAARLVGEVVGYSGQIKFDKSRPDGASQKLMNSTKLSAVGWHAKVGLKEGLQAKY